ncbi:glucose/quinate/shikimate family membrane-bound PQQ-dependent dehydrogenase [Qingshengfaniella alkalisoli]|uniref:Glucose/quinate/shikimate family membrane-bound PQQ-dependent dehydrogenase n=1 Tax=Qingshengfaniella alkalisoli TaxID=2599296 RepID=A0A5B8ID59_9RHOB|nr:glucose/quinate/shikimate family membrane-bound PQQ-dependent dehydrogenase [Qingshengfaniella alkalisoli]QDY71586.1 glucose/quinate/shikimate family membrane-bound PQQ-dependent dehydrogenase [Qingshengfaniella alkalisoli]
MLHLITAIIFALLGTVLGIGGVWLAALGGSWYYAVAGIVFLTCAWCTFQRDSRVFWIYSAYILGSLAWAIWEIGFDWWQLGARGGLIVLLGLWLCLPAIRRGMHDGRSKAIIPLALSNALAIVIAVISMTQNVIDIPGRLPEAVVTPDPALGDDFGPEDWHRYGRTQYGQRYSPLEQITRDNVAQLELAWQFQTGDVKGPDDVGETTYQVTPLKIRDTLYVCTPHNWAIAIDAVSGEQKWKFDANSGLEPDRQHQTCRGVTYWKNPDIDVGDPCAERVYLPTADARLIALDAADGSVCDSFAENGTLHLERGMPFNPAGFYYSTSPPIAVDGKLIIGGAVNDNYSIYSPSGVIRAFDILTGELLWNWDSANPNDTTPINIADGETYTANSPNSWSVFSVDPELGMVYIPLGNQVPDQLGMGRSDAVEAHSSSVVALNVDSGQQEWVFQTVHHDLWDMDVPAQPVLLDLTAETDENIPALVQPTKQGDIYVLDRRNGEPFLPVSERDAPGGAIPEDFTAPSQPVSKLTFEPRPLRGRDMWGASLIDQMICRIRLHRYSYEGRYTPPSPKGTIVYPGNFGVFNWGSIAVDPERQVMFGMPTHLAFIQQLIPAEDLPPLDPEAKGSEHGVNRNEGAPYGVNMHPFLGPLGVPCQAPPWGYVAGADLRTGDIAYLRKNGTIRDMTPLPLPFELGVPGIGGPIITKGGVAFLAAAVDDYLRAYDLTTGEVLWKGRLPAGGQSTPMTYAVDGTQYVVIVAGGHGSIGTKPGDYILAYKLPNG